MNQLQAALNRLTNLRAVTSGYWLQLQVLHARRGDNDQRQRFASRGSAIKVATLTVDELDRAIADLEAHKAENHDVAMPPPPDYAAPLRAYFKEAVAEARKSPSKRGAIFHCCSINQSWFGKKGDLAYLTDEFIDNLGLDEVKLRLALFIMRMYQQR